jgi:hypothetical protein
MASPVVSFTQERTTWRPSLVSLGEGMLSGQAVVVEFVTVELVSFALVDCKGVEHDGPVYPE